VSGCATEGGIPNSAPIDNPRLHQAMAKLRRGESVSIAALGGSITTGYQASSPASNGWAALVARWWREKAAETGGKVVFHNSGASGTDSAFASIRVQDHVLAYNPDVVFVEFGVNDQWLNARVRQRSYEGVLRQILADSERSVIILALNEKANANKSTRVEEEKIGRHYGLPTLAWADWVKLADWDRYFTGSEAIHPNTEGHASIASGIIKYLDAAWNSLPPDEALLPVDAALPAALVSAEFQNAALIGGSDTAALVNPLASTLWRTWPAELPGEWVSRGGAALSGWTTSDSAADLAIRVKGKSVGVLFAESDQYRNALAWIEGGTENPKKITINSYVSYRSGYYGFAYAEVADNLDPNTEHVLHLTLNPADGKPGGVTGIIGVICTGAGEAGNP
jgi:lysophospholipase L1-like esterase